MPVKVVSSPSVDAFKSRLQEILARLLEGLEAWSRTRGLGEVPPRWGVQTSQMESLQHCKQGHVRSQRSQRFLEVVCEGRCVSEAWGVPGLRAGVSQELSSQPGMLALQLRGAQT